VGKSKQGEMFDDGSDLPLFSGSAVRVTLPVVGERPASHPALFCRFCGGTGRLIVAGKCGLCTCEAGRELSRIRRCDGGTVEAD
jgi:hypothetical protein